MHTIPKLFEKQLLKHHLHTFFSDFVHPTAFIFPAKLGNSLLFCVQGFTLLVNGGNEACPYWKLIRHLQRLVKGMKFLKNKNKFSNRIRFFFSKSLFQF